MEVRCARDHALLAKLNHHVKLVRKLQVQVEYYGRKVIRNQAGRHHRGSLQIAPPGFGSRASFVGGYLFHCKGQNLGKCELLNRNNLGDVAPQQAVVAFIYRLLPQGIGVGEVDLCAPLFRLSEILKSRTVVSGDGINTSANRSPNSACSICIAPCIAPLVGGNPHGDVVACHSTNEGKDDVLLAIASANNRIGLPLTHFGAGINNGRPIFNAAAFRPLASTVFPIGTPAF